MELIHGTPVRNALSILRSGVIKGTKRKPEHHHAYVSFSSSFHSAKDFGNILFHVSYHLDTFIEVEYENRDWMRQNREIVEYIGVWYESEEETERELHAIQFEQEFVVKDEYKWRNILNFVTIIADEKEDVTKVIHQINELSGGTIPIKLIRKSPIIVTLADTKFIQDFKKQLRELEERMQATL